MNSSRIEITQRKGWFIAVVDLGGGVCVCPEIDKWAANRKDLGRIHKDSQHTTHKAVGAEHGKWVCSTARCKKAMEIPHDTPIEHRVCLLARVHSA